MNDPVQAFGSSSTSQHVRCRRGTWRLPSVGEGDLRVILEEYPQTCAGAAKMKSRLVWLWISIAIALLVGASYLLPRGRELELLKETFRSSDVTLATVDGRQIKLFDVVDPDQAALLFLDAASAASPQVRALAARMQVAIEGRGSFVCVVPPESEFLAGAADWWLIDAEGKAAKAYKVRKYPHLAILGPDRTVPRREDGCSMEYLEQLVQHTEAAVAGLGPSGDMPSAGCAGDSPDRSGGGASTCEGCFGPMGPGGARPMPGADTLPPDTAEGPVAE